MRLQLGKANSHEEFRESHDRSPCPGAGGGGGAWRRLLSSQAHMRVLLTCGIEIYPVSLFSIAVKYSYPQNMSSKVYFLETLFTLS